MNQPLISIIMPVYGVEKYIEKSLQSVKNQQYQNFELVIVDDETTDNSIKVAEKVLHDATFPYSIFHKKNGGLGDSRNYGLQHAKGEWILFLDSDDMLQPSTLADMANALEGQEDIQFVFSRFQKVYLNEEFKPSPSDEGSEILDYKELQKDFLLRNKIILAPGTLYNRDWLLTSKLFFEKVPYSEDQLFVWNILKKCNHAIYIKKELYNYLQRPNSIMTSSKYPQIVAAYPYFKKLEDAYQDETHAIPMVKKHILSRWVMGILNSSAQLCTFQEFSNIVRIFEARKHCQKLLAFPQLKVSIMAFILLLSKSLYYKIIRQL